MVLAFSLTNIITNCNPPTGLLYDKLFSLILLRLLALDVSTLPENFIAPCEPFVSLRLHCNISPD